MKENYGLPEISPEGISEDEYRHRVKYRNVYLKLIVKGLGMTSSELSGYNERHHILPRCMGGEDRDENYVLLPIRYHVMAHVLLLEAYPDHRGIAYSAHQMTNTDPSRNIDAQKYFSTRTLSKIKEKAHEAVSGKNHPNFGKHASDETKRKMSVSRSGDRNPSARKVVSPDGKIYGSVKSAARECGIPYGTLKKWLLGLISNNHGWVYLKETKKHYGNTNSTTKRVCGPDGRIYESMKEAGASNGVSAATIKRWIEGKTLRSPGWKFA